MRRLRTALFLSSVLVLPLGCSSSTTPGKKDGGAGAGGASGSAGGTSGSAGGTSGSAGGTSGSAGGAGADGGAGTGGTTTDGGDAPIDGADGGLTVQETRGQYLVKSVLGCPGCHTPSLTGDAGTGPDNSKFLAGVTCFSKNTAGDCLNSANLTPSGLGNFSDAQVKAAFTAGIYPQTTDGGTQYLFAQMPYYQFSFLTSDDADAIVAYLRTIPAVATTPPADTGAFATRPTAAQWATVALSALPSPTTADGGTDAGTDGGADGGATGSASNGKYFAALLCSTCHTVNTTATAPLQLDATKAFEGGKTSTVTVTVPADGGTDGAADGGDGGATTMTASKQIESANLTPDVTGLEGWTIPQITTAITTAKDNMSRSICGMRAFSTLAAQDALDIATYLQAIPAVSNTISPTCY